MAYVRSILCGLALAACSSAAPTPTPGPGPVQPGGDDITGTKPKQCDFHDAMACLSSCTPAECYPGLNLGYVERKLGNPGTPGNRIPNMRFLGHLNLDTATATATSGELKPIQLSDFYDPTGVKYRVIRIVVGATWCGPCNQEADFIVNGGIPQAVAPSGVVFIQALNDGPANWGSRATQQDLENWISNHKLNFSAFLDSDNKLGPFWAADAVPENVTIDARSMEILAKQAGSSQAVQTELQKWADWTKANPPQAL